MTKLTFLSVASVLALASSLYACGGSASSGSSPGGCTGSTAITPGGTASSACSTCEQANCTAELSAAFGSGFTTGTPGGACAAYMECTRACACGDTSCYSGCQGKIDASCQSAVTAVSACESQKCKTECSSTGAGGSGAGGSGAGGSTSGTFTPSFSCAVSQEGALASCGEYGTPFPGGQAALDMAKQNCTDDGNTPGTACPTAGALGSCLIGGFTRAFYYPASGLTAAQAEMACMQASGTWKPAG